ncbi:receptor kinase-like protein Xa21 [Ananas comosus]|uniref:Receptor kinase-like protein Xa21 n=1 Tax=Ananas comosus TaxID=4615 RepID=A0A6P5FKX9_ANACO|nr:receptor kinase-like protein Xa21 [Ananas comosus]
MVLMELPLTFIAKLKLLLILIHTTYLLVFASSLSLVGNKTDHLALLSFKASIIDDPSGTLSSWNDTLPFCKWAGVTCGGQHPDRVVALDLESLNLTGMISPFITNLTFLRRLHLPYNKLYGPIPSDIGHLTRLRFLNLSYNSLDGEIPSSIARCSALKCICLGANKLEGRLPAFLRNCTELEIISLRANRLHGEVPSALSTLTKLLRLILGTNNLTGGIPSSLGNLSTLSIFDVADNNLEGNIPDTLGKITNLGAFQICINQFTGTIPSSIYNLSSVWWFHVAENKLTGTLPSNIGSSFPTLQHFLMYQNQFEGQIPSSLVNASGLIRIELAGNRFTGPVPPNLGVLKNLVEVLLASNQIEDGEANGWSFLTSLTNCTSLQVIDLYDNKLKGRFPNIVSNLSTGLQKLSMNNNQITGNIPEGIGNLLGLTALYLEQNFLTGPIPDTIGKLRKLNVLSLHENRISGQIPFSLGNLTSLTRLTLDHCDLQGPIPTSFDGLQNLELLDLSSNKLNGTIPKELVSLSSLSRYLTLPNNSLHGSLPIEVGSLRNIELLDVSENNLSGAIPTSLGQCQIVVYLYLEGNSFEGPIPETLSNLKGIQELDLSRNKLSGKIPDFLERLQSLQRLNLSFNNFGGEVPTEGVFGNLSAISIQGNKELCGVYPGLHLEACPTQTKRRKRIQTHILIIILAAAFSSFLLLISVYIIIHRCKRSRKMTVDTVPDMNHFQQVSYSYLAKATDGFSQENLIGVGSFGSVYKGMVREERKVVAIKVLNLQQHGASRSFIAECEALRNIRHRNLVKIITVCSSIDFNGNNFKALIYEFMPNGNLEEWLHPKDGDLGEPRSLRFIQRLNIAIDVGSALDYLHSHGPNPMVHCDLKPSNILLDSDMSAHVGDFGLARFLWRANSMKMGNASSSNRIRGTIGYVAPEYGTGSRASVQGDLYSFGILILEIFIGRRPTDEVFKDGLSLRIFAEMAFPENLMEIVDPQLLMQQNREANENAHAATISTEEMLRYLEPLIRMGLSCSMELPKERMAMDDALRTMHAVRNAFFQG